MKLSKFQKEIIKYIAFEKVKNVSDFIEFFIENKKDEVNRILIEELNLDEFTYKIIDYLTIKDTLLKEGLLIIEEFFAREILFFPKQSDDKSIFLTDLVNKYRNETLFIKPLIHDFIANDFNTQKEMAFDEEKKSRKLAQKITIFIAVFSIIFTTAINFLTFSNERVVKIKNFITPNDTLKVLLINPSILQRVNVISDTSEYKIKRK